jgi:glycosyltransferase involved in cell wall biosynthesis
MKKNIWIWNHYATNGFFDQGGRHYWFAKVLLQHGYEPVIFCASTVHNSTKCVDTDGKRYAVDVIDGIRYVFVQTPPYHGNRFARIKNMYAFYRNLLRIYKEIADAFNGPDLILASSVHPLTLVAGIKVAKKISVPCICEIRDLWPLSLTAYGMIREKSLLARLLYCGEKWIYKRADAIVMTFAGGRQYILDRGWESEIDLEKVFYVNNGVDLDEFERSAEQNMNEALHANTESLQFARRKIVYAGSIRLVNNVGYILNLGKALAERGSDLEIVVYGDGDERAALSERRDREKINNVTFAGSVPKQQIPSILREAYMTILHLQDNAVFRYGLSANKLFEYLAAGKPVIQTLQSGYDIITEYACGISSPVLDEGLLTDEIIALAQDHERYEFCSANAKKAARDFDFRHLTEKLIAVIEHTERI